MSGTAKGGAYSFRHRHVCPARCLVEGDAGEPQLGLGISQISAAIEHLPVDNQQLHQPDLPGLKRFHGQPLVFFKGRQRGAFQRFDARSELLQCLPQRDDGAFGVSGAALAFVARLLELRQRTADAAGVLAK